MSGRILALLGDSFHASGGIAQFNRDLIVAWAELENIAEIVLVPRFASEPGSDLPERVVERSPLSSLPLYVLKAALESIRRPPFDIIFCGHLNMVPLAVTLSKLTGTPVWLQLHGIEAWSRPSPAVHWSAERAALVTCVSRQTRRLFLRWANLPPQQVLVLPNTVAEKFNWNDAPDPRPVGHMWAGNKVLLTVARLSAQEGYKGHDKIIRCMPALSTEFDNLIYAIAGTGDQQET